MLLFLREGFSERLNLHESSPFVAKSAISDLCSSQCRLCFRFGLRVVYLETSHKL